MRARVILLGGAGGGMIEKCETTSTKERSFQLRANGPDQLWKSYPYETECQNPNLCRITTLLYIDQRQDVLKALTPCPPPILSNPPNHLNYLHLLASWCLANHLRLKTERRTTLSLSLGGA